MVLTENIKKIDARWMNEVLECAELVDNSKDDFLDSIIVFSSRIYSVQDYFERRN